MRFLVAVMLLALAVPVRADEVYLDVVVNDKPIRVETSEFSQAGDVLEAAPAVWEALGLLLTDEERKQPKLSNVQLGLSLTIDTTKQVASFKAPPERIPTQQLGEKKRARPHVSPTASGVLVNYDLAAVVGPKTPLAVSLGHEVRIAGNWGVLSTTGQLNASKNGVTYKRGFTTYTYDDPEHTMSYQAGDILTTPTSTSGGVMMGGLRIASDPSLDSTQPRFPVPVLGGVAVGTSTLDTYMNGNHQTHNDVELGNFLTPELPVIQGANSVDLVLKDQFGRTTTITKDIYLSTHQLRKGLNEWEVNVGLVRQGASDNYKHPALSANYSRGLTDKFTLDTHVEAAKEGHNIGVGTRAILGNYGSIDLGVAKSSGPQGDGTKLNLNYEYSTRNWGVHAGYFKQSENWFDLSQLTDTPSLLPMDHSATGMHVGGTFSIPNKRMSITVNAARIETFDKTRTRVDARWQWDKQNSSWGAGVSVADNDKQLWVSYRHSFGNRASVLAQASSKNGMIQSSIEGHANFNRGDKSDVDVSARVGDNGRAVFGDATARWKTDNMEVATRLDVYDGDWRVSGNIRGSAWMGSGTKALMRAVDEGFAVVRVPGVAGVPVKLENKLVGVTNAKGALVIGPMQELEASKITIDERALPAEVTVETSEIMAVPNRGHGALVEFPIRTMSARAFKVKMAGGFPEVGSEVKAEKETTVIGHDGDLFLEHAEAGMRLTLTHNDTSCSMTIPSPLPSFEEIAELECK